MQGVSAWPDEILRLGAFFCSWFFLSLRYSGCGKMTGSWPPNLTSSRGFNLRPRIVAPGDFCNGCGNLLANFAYQRRRLTKNSMLTIFGRNIAGKVL